MQDFHNCFCRSAKVPLPPPFPTTFSLFSKIFSIFSKKFSKCAPFCGFHYTIYMERKKSDLLSGRNNGFIHILLIFGIVLCRIAIPPGDRFSSVQIDDIFSPFSLRDTRSFLMSRRENVGRKPFPPAIQRDVNPVLSDDAVLFLYIKISSMQYARRIFLLKSDNVSAHHVGIFFLAGEENNLMTHCAVLEKLA